MMDGFWFGLFLVLLSLIISAFFSMTETVVTSTSRLKAEHLRQKKGVQARILGLWIHYPHRVLAAVLIGNNLLNIFASVTADHWMETSFGVSSIFFVTLLMTVMIVIFAEILPKTLGKTFANQLIVPTLKVFEIFYFILFPLTWCASGISAFAHKFLGLFIKGKNEPEISASEIEFLIQMGQKEGIFIEEKYSMLANTLELGETLVREIMVHRLDIVALPKDTPLSQAVDVFQKTGLSRIPLFEGSLDRMIGFIHAKDLLFFLTKNAKYSEENSLQNILSTPVFQLQRKILMVPETKKAQILFKEMQRLREPIAVVLDEYGGTAGLITMEDILEEVVGQIRDDFDIEEDAIRPVEGQTPGVETFLVEGKVHIQDFCDFFGVDILKIRTAGTLHIFDTIGGFILHLSGKVPRQGEVFSAGGLVFEVIDVTQSRVRRLLVRRSGR